jgi:hypothetical protein
MATAWYADPGWWAAIGTYALVLVTFALVFMDGVSEHLSRVSSNRWINRFFRLGLRLGELVTATLGRGRNHHLPRSCRQRIPHGNSLPPQHACARARTLYAP